MKVSSTTLAAAFVIAFVIVPAAAQEIRQQVPLGTSGHKVPFLDGANTWSAANGFQGVTASTAAIGGAVIGSNALAVTGTANISGLVTGSLGFINTGSTLNAVYNANSSSNGELRALLARNISAGSNSIVTLSLDHGSNGAGLMLRTNSNGVATAYPQIQSAASITATSNATAGLVISTQAANAPISLGINSAEQATLTATEFSHNSTQTTGVTLYNTADKTTNYERLRLFWNSNNATIATESAGSGGSRDLTLNSVSGNIRFQANGTTVFSMSSGPNGIVSTNGSGWSLPNATASSTVPTIVPRRSDTTTGIGAQAAGNVSVIIGGTERARYGALSQAAWTSNGVNIRQTAQTYTDTSSSGTISSNIINLFDTPTLAFSSSTTVSSAYNAYFRAPVAGTNATLSSQFGLATEGIDVVGANGIRLGGAGGAGISPSNAQLSIALAATTGTNPGVRTVTTGTGFSASTGQQVVLQIAPTINQTSTAGYTALQVGVTETATGSGMKRLADFLVGGVSKTSISNAGDVTLAGSLTVSASHTPSSASDTCTAGRIAWNTDYMYVCTSTNSWKRAALSAW